MIYREMPAIWDPAFRPRFYESWGRENAVVCARARRVEYPEYQQLLSIKAACGGTEHYYVDGRHQAVDDHTYLILNASRKYGSRIDEIAPVQSFSIFFAPQQAERTLTALCSNNDSLLDAPHLPKVYPVEFDERLREHDQWVSPHLHSIRRRLEEGMDDELWLEEQLHLLLARMLISDRSLREKVANIPSSRPATRAELHRRLGLATDFIHSNYKRSLCLQDMAAAAHLSPFHFLRLFKKVFQMSPSAYLNRRRVMEAQLLMRDSRSTLLEIAEMVGFGSRTSLFRHLKAFGARASEPC